MMQRRVSLLNFKVQLTFNLFRRRSLSANHTTTIIGRFLGFTLERFDFCWRC